MTDRELKQRVQRALDQDPDLDTTTIGVTVCRGIVTLHGAVATPEERAAAERTAQYVRHVRAVADDLELAPTRVVARTDVALARAAANTLASYRAIPAGAVDVDVRDAWVFLSGTVTCSNHKLAAERLVRLLYGVQGVFSAIAVVPTPDPGGPA